MDDILVHRLELSFNKRYKSIALKKGSATYTYEELDLLSNKVANYLLKNFIDEKFIGVWAEKEFPTYSFIIGILKAGKAYIPLNPKFPNARNQQIINESQVKIILSANEIEYKNVSFSDLFINPDKVNYDNQRIKYKYQADEPVYMLFTSGSTGRPKGVLIKNNQLINYLDSVQNICNVNPDDILSHTFDLTFDLSVHDIFMTFINGATLCVPTENDLISPANYIKSNKITHWFSVPSLIRQMIKLKQLKTENFPSIKNALLCGEALSTDTALNFKNSISKAAKIFNLYGPTEATISVTSYEIKTQPKELHGNISLGKVFKCNEFLILNDENIASEVGELLLKGKQVIHSYFNKEINSNHFFTDSNGEIWYRTGDLVKKDGEGDLYYLGRKDAQVKLNGFRIELHEIENCIIRNFNFMNTICFISENNNYSNLVSVIQSDKELEISTIKSKLSELLPTYMIPKFFVFLKEFPHNSNRKIDRNAIKEWYQKEYAEKGIN